MAANIQQNDSKDLYRRPDLVGKIDGIMSDIYCAAMIPCEDGIITACEDRSIRMWLPRDGHRYWPAFCNFLPSPVTVIEYSNETHRIFFGCANGTVVEQLLAEDANSMQHRRDYLAHTGYITGVRFSLQSEWILSSSKDKSFTWHCSETGHRLGGHTLDHPITAMQYDVSSKFAFLGDSSGAITILRVQTSKAELVSTFKGHTEAIRSLAWDPLKSRLFSGGSDNTVIAWDIGGGKGTAYELQAHERSVSSVLWCNRSRQVISGGEDGLMVLWNMDVERKETPSWKESDVCHVCSTPFFWNIRRMWEDKIVGVRQHHCRICGQAVCDKCSPQSSTYPIMGFEREVRVCNSCIGSVKDVDRVPLASISDTKHVIVDLHLDETKRIVITVGKDKVVKIWDMKSLIT